MSEIKKQLHREQESHIEILKEIDVTKAVDIVLANALNNLYNPSSWDPDFEQQPKEEKLARLLTVRDYLNDTVKILEEELPNVAPNWLDLSMQSIVDPDQLSLFEPDQPDPADIAAAEAVFGNPDKDPSRFEPDPNPDSFPSKAYSASEVVAALFAASGIIKDEQEGGKE